MAKIIALIDGSIYSESVCDHTAWIAGPMGASVEVIHVLGRREGTQSNLSGNIGLGARSKLMEELADLDMQRAKLAGQRGRAILHDAKSRIQAAGVAEVTARLRQEDLLHTLQEAEGDADLVVIGKRGEAADFAKLHLGSNLERVVRASHKPVLVTARAFRPIETVLIAFDGGTSALKAVDHIARNPAFASLNAKVLWVGNKNTEAQRKVDGAVAMLSGAGISATGEIVAGQPEQVISARTDQGEAQLLVMGAFGHSRIRNLMVGSTTTAMIRSCTIPVLLFR